MKLAQPELTAKDANHTKWLAAKDHKSRKEMNR
jgi:hypothetical protein